MNNRCVVSKRRAHQNIRCLINSLILALSLARLAEPTVQSQTAVNVLTWHNDTAHTGQNLQEVQLTLDNLNTNTFGLPGDISSPSIAQASLNDPTTPGVQRFYRAMVLPPVTGTPT